MRIVGYVTCALLLLAVALPAFAQQPFSDVPANHWAYNAVNGLAEQGLLEGYPDGTFKGKQSLTRYEFAQAIARMMDRMEQMGGIAGPAGPPGPPGAGGGLTPEQQALLDKLAKEFAPELKALRSDLDALTKRVEDLENAPKPEMPKITVSGNMSWRTGVYGTDLGTEDVSATGYPFFDGLQITSPDPLEFQSAFGGINIPFFDPGQGLWSDDPTFVGATIFTQSVPISDSLKDAFKASDFMTMKTRVNFAGQLTDDVAVKVGLLAGPQTNRANLGDWEDAGSPVSLSGNGLMDTVQVDEAWVKYKTQFITPVELTAGKQYFKRAQGLLADNDQEPIKAFRVDWMGGDWSWGALWGMLDREQFLGRTTGVLGDPSLEPAVTGLPDPETSGQDNYNLYMLDWKLAKEWNLGASWLESGFDKESGWNVGLNGKAWGLDWYGEYAKMLDWPTGDGFNDLNGDGVEDPGEVPLDDSDTAWLAGLKWNSNFVNVTGEYGEVDAGYAFAFTGGGWSAVNPLAGMGMYTDFFNLPLSALHPNAEVDPHDINWIDRPLFLDPTNIARGWHVNVTFPTLFGKATPLSISYMDGDAYDPRFLSWLMAGGSNSSIVEPDEWRDADAVWVVKLSHQFTDNVSANVLYGRREVDNVMSPQVVPVTTDEDGDRFAEKDPIQVLRAEVCVAF